MALSVGGFTMRKRYATLLVAFLAACLWSNASVLPLLGRNAFLRSTSTAQLFSEAYLAQRRALHTEDGGEGGGDAPPPQQQQQQRQQPEAAAASPAGPSVAPTPAATSPAAAAKAAAAEPPPQDPSKSPTSTPARTATSTGTPARTGSPTRTPEPAALPYTSLSGELPDVPPDWAASPALNVQATSRFAYVTLAAGNDAGRMAVALMQSIVSSGTNTSEIDLVVLLPTNGLGSPECHDPAWRAANNRTHVFCGREEQYDLLCEEVISPPYCDALRRLGVKLVVHRPIPHTQWTLGISGGPQAFWGMSLQRMVIFNLTQYAKIVWSDADTLVLRNMDHLFGPEYPTLSSSFTHGCCNRNAPALPGGGLWVLEPSAALGLLVWRMIEEGMPVFDKSGQPRVHARTGNLARQVWLQSDMSLIQHMFNDWSRNPDTYRLWPWVRDTRHGYAPGIRSMPLYQYMTDAQFAAETADPQTGRPRAEGFRPELVKPADDGRMVWHALPVQYDQCYSNCDCIPWRWPAPESNQLFSVHFSCIINGNDKPGKYPSEKALFTAMEGWTDCAKFYYTAWYDALSKALGGALGEPYGKPRPPINSTALNTRPHAVVPVKFSM